MSLFGAFVELARPGPLTLERAWSATRKAFAPEPPAVVFVKRCNANVRDGAGLINDVLPDEEPAPAVSIDVSR